MFKNNPNLPYFFSIVILFLLICGGGSLYFASFEHKREVADFLRVEARDEISYTLTSINERLDIIVDTLGLISLEGALEGQTEYLEKTRQLLLSQSFIQTINYISADQIIRYVSPYEANEILLGLKISLPWQHEALEHVKSTMTPILSRPHELAQGGWGYSLFVPGRNDNFWQIVFKSNDLFGKNGFLHASSIVVAKITDGSTVIFNPEHKFAKRMAEHEQVLFGRLFNRQLKFITMPAHALEDQGKTFWARLVPFSIVATFTLFILIIYSQARQLRNKKLQQDLLNSQIQLQQSLLDALPFPSFLLESSSRKVILANKVATGLGGAEGEKCFQSWGSQGEICSWCPLGEDFSQESPQRFVQEIYGKIWDVWLIKVSAELCLHLAVDVTETRYILAEIQKSEERYKRLVETIPAKVCRIAKDGTIIFANQAFCADLDQNLEELIGKNYLDLVGDKNRDEIADSLSLLNIEKPFHSFECRRESVAGKEFWERWTTQALIYKSGPDEIYEFQVCQFDITSQIQTQEKLRQATRELSHLLTSLPIIPYTALIQDEVVINYISGRVEDITGFSHGEFLRDRHFWCQQMHPEDRQRVMADFHSLVSRVDKRDDFRFKNKNGQYIWLRNIFRSDKLLEDDSIACTGVWFDVTEEMKVRKESKLRMQQVVQADKLASLGAVVAGVAHEINNPVSFITYNTPIMRKIWDIFRPALEQYNQEHPDWATGGFSFSELAENMAEIIDAIDIGTERITKVVLNLKDFAQLGDASSNKPVGVNEVIDKTLTIVGGQIRKTFKQIDLDLDDNLPEIQGDFLKLEQVIANLLVNAAQAAQHKQGARLAIRSRFREHLDAVVLEVEDNGVGVAPENLAQIFDPFFTTKRDSGGTGLGLSVSYGIVKEHQGLITLLTRENVGSRFAVILPRDRRNSKCQIQPTILCVDDDEFFLGLMERYFLKIDGTGIKTFDSAERVVDHIGRHPEIDFIVSDVVMPNIDGWELLARVKEKYPLLPVILCSGSTWELDKKESLFQPDLCLEKPITGSELLKNINEIGRMQIWGFS